MEDKKVKLIEVTVKLKEKQLKKGDNGIEYWKIHFDGQVFINSTQLVTFYTDADVDPSPRIVHSEIESFITKLIYDV